MKKPCTFRLGKHTLEQLDALVVHLAAKDSTGYYRRRMTRTRALEYAIYATHTKAKEEEKCEETPVKQSKPRSSKRVTR